MNNDETVNREPTDYELICECKKEKSKSYLILFNRYKPYLSKRYYQMKRLIKDKRNIIEFKDFVQEAFFYFDQAVDYTNLNKITDPKHWKFLTPYMYFIRNLIKIQVSKTNKELTIIKDNPKYFSDFSKDVLDLLELKDEYSINPYENIIQKEAVISFKKSLSESELNMCETLENLVSKNSKSTIKEASKILGCSSGWGYLICRKIKNKYNKETFFV
jgi:hypothetical protein